MIPRELTIATVDEQLPALVSYAGRHGWAAQWSPDQLLLSVDGRHPDATLIRVGADVTGFPAQPPAWTIAPIDPSSSAAGKFPQAGALPDVNGSILHGNRLICAPFNRLAFSVHGGPHGDWTLTAWRDVRGYVRADTLSEMLAVIVAHLKYSPGWF